MSFTVWVFCMYFRLTYRGSAKYLTFFWKCFKQNLLNIFPNFFFYLKVQSFRLIMEMENNFIQMAASAGPAAAYTNGPIFKHIINSAQLYFTNGFTNIVPSSINCLWIVGVTPSQIILQRCQIIAPGWPNNISSAADNAIFRSSAQNIER